MPLDADGGINTSDDSEYTEDEEYMTDNEDEYEDEEGHIEHSTCCFSCDGRVAMNGRRAASMEVKMCLDVVQSMKMKKLS